MATSKNRQSIETLNQLVYDETKQAWRVTGDLTATVQFPAEQQVEVSAADGDSILLVGTTDGTLTGTQKVVRTLADGTVVVTSSGVSGTFTEVAPTDFRASTVTPTGSPAAISFAGFTMVSVSLYCPPDNNVPLRIGKADVNTNYFLLTPGSSLNLPLQASSTPVYYQLDSAGSAQLSILALGG
jgi:hypothetical protein